MHTDPVGFEVSVFTSCLDIFCSSVSEEKTFQKENCN